MKRIIELDEDEQEVLAQAMDGHAITLARAYAANLDKPKVLESLGEVTRMLGRLRRKVAPHIPIESFDKSVTFQDA